MLRRGQGLIAILVCGALFGCTDPTKPRVATSIEVTPGDTVLCASGTAQFQATVLDANGEEIRNAEVSWSSTQPDVADISASGLLTAEAGGSAVIRATQGSIFGETTIGVRTPEIRFSNSEPWVFVGDTVRLSAQIVDLNDIAPPEASTDWASGAPTVATVTSTGLVTGMQSGVATITTRGPCGAQASIATTVLEKPNGLELAYDRWVYDYGWPHRQLRIVSLDGSKNRAITPADADVHYHAWSPDGNRIVITYSGVGRNGSVVVDANGRNEVPFGPKLTHPEWSPDGSRIVFHLVANRQSDVYTIRPDGSDLQQLSDAPGYEMSPRWSPDGQEILYLHSPSDTISDLWIVKADGSSRRKVPLPTRALTPAWSPDGRYIAFDNGSGVWIVDADGTNPRPFTPNCTASGTCPGPDRYVYPVWSPDGQRLAYARVQSGAWSVVIARADDASTPIANVSPMGLCCEELRPSWSPDGTHISFRDTLLPGSRPAIVVMDANGNGLRYVTGQEYAHPQGWRPGIR